MVSEQVKENIIDALHSNQLNAKVMIGDHFVTPIERERYIIPYDNTKRRLTNKIKRYIATKVVNRVTKNINETTFIHGLNNLEGLKNQGAILTCNHFSPLDSLVVRTLTNKIGYKHRLSIVVSEANIFMKGKLGWLLKNINTMPFTNNLKYIEHNFNPALEKRLGKGHIILFYPEQEMWPAYIKPRPLKSGAYHYASKYKVPIISTFVALEKKDNKVYYHLFIAPLIYPSEDLSLKENKRSMLEKDFNNKQNFYESFYKKRLTYDYDESDLVF